MLAATLGSCMRPAIAIAALLLIASTAVAQTNAWQATDPDGDIALAGVPLLDAAGLDMRSLAIADSPENVSFRLELAPSSVARDELNALEQLYHVQFTASGRQLVLEFGRPMGQGNFVSVRLLELLDDAYSAVASPTGHLNGNVMTTTLERSLFGDERGNVPARGERLTQLFVTSNNPLLANGGTSISDRLPDTGQLEYEFQSGNVKQGDIGITTSTPFYSNTGVGGLYVFDLQVENEGLESLHVELGSDNVPMSWRVQFVPASLELEPTSTQNVSAVLHVGGAHLHGASSSLPVQVRDSGGNVVATTGIGMYFPSPAYPSFHHPVLSFHSIADPRGSAELERALGTADGLLFMDTDPESDLDQRQPIMSKITPAPTGISHTWYIHMKELAGGINLLPATDMASAAFALTSTRPVTLSTVTGHVDVLGPGPKTSSPYPPYSDRNVTQVATLVGSGVSLDATTTTPLTMTLSTPGVDVPPQIGQSLVLVIEAQEQLPTPLPPTAMGIQLEPGGQARLPFASPDEGVRTMPGPGLSLRVDEAPHSVVAPAGRLYLEVENTGTQEENFRVHILSNLSDVPARISSDQKQLGPSGIFRVDLEVDVSGAEPHSTVWVFVAATREGSRVPAVIQIPVHVMPAENLQSPSNESPSGYMVSLCVALAAIALIRRRSGNQG